jgi:hypothetical protein
MGKQSSLIDGLCQELHIEVAKLTQKLSEVAHSRIEETRDKIYRELEALSGESKKEDE